MKDGLLPTQSRLSVIPDAECDEWWIHRLLDLFDGLLKSRSNVESWRVSLREYRVLSWDQLSLTRGDLCQVELAAYHSGEIPIKVITQAAFTDSEFGGINAGDEVNSHTVESDYSELSIVVEKELRFLRESGVVSAEVVYRPLPHLPDDIAGDTVLLFVGEVRRERQGALVPQVPYGQVLLFAQAPQ